MNTHRRMIFAGLVLGPLALQPLAVGAQAEPPPLRRLGVLGNAPVLPASVSEKLWLARGWRVGGNLLLEERYARGDMARLGELARELVATRVDVIYAEGDLAAQAAAEATRTVPIVMSGLAPVETGLARSLARPGGNVTGVVFQANDYMSKQLDLLRAIRPGLQRIGIVDRGSRYARRWHAGWQEAAQRWDISLHKVPFPVTLAELDATLAVAQRERVQAFEFGLNYALRGEGWRAIGGWPLQHKVVTSAADYARGEVMLSFGANGAHYTQLIFDQLDCVLRGANPADLPIQQPTVFDIVIDKRQLRAIGLEVPRSVLVQATEVIE